jgi:hypothetical protein
MLYAEKGGRSGRSGHVIGRGLGRSCASPPTRPRNILHVEKLASTVNSTAAQCTSQSIRVMSCHVSDSVDRSAADLDGESFQNPGSPLAKSSC